MNPPLANPLKSHTVAVLGYGNQGRAQAQNLRDSGVSVIVGARPGSGADEARLDNFEVLNLAAAAERATIIMFLLPDHIIPEIYESIGSALEGKFIGFSHGFALHFCHLKIWKSSSYFLVSPKGAGVWLRKNFASKTFLPGVFAIGETPDRENTKQVALAYAQAIGVSQRYLQETTFQEEVECDLFGEQTVLCGGIPELIENAYRILIERGHQPEMAFFECFYEAKLIIDLMLEYGPKGMAGRISPTAFYGGKMVGRRLVNQTIRAEMDKVFDEIRSGEFARQWMQEAAKKMPHVEQWKKELGESPLQKTYDQLHDVIK